VSQTGLAWPYGCADHVSVNGVVFKLEARTADGEPLWAYRYRVEGRASARPQVRGFASRAEAQRALQKKLARLAPGGRAATPTLGAGISTFDLNGPGGPNEQAHVIRAVIESIVCLPFLRHV
jgi:hypothetical protein